MNLQGARTLPHKFSRRRYPQSFQPARWKTRKLADVASIDEASLELWSAEWLREMAGEEVAALWLRPLRCKCGNCSIVSWPAAQITVPEAREHQVLAPVHGGQELVDLRP